MTSGHVADAPTLGEATVREFREELGRPAPDGEPVPLGSVRQAGGKVVHAWAVAGDFDADHVESMAFEMEWPPRSGRKQEFPEVDRATWFDLQTARRMILQAQSTFLDRLEAALSTQDRQRASS